MNIPKFGLQVASTWTSPNMHQHEADKPLEDTLRLLIEGGRKSIRL